MELRKIIDINSDYEYLFDQYNKIKNSKYNQYFHIEPLTGLLNDPNGFSYHNGKWVLFYQWYPFGPFHGQKHWYMTESTDLVKFENKGVGLIPEEEFENFGAYSGTALSTNGDLNIFYTANYRDEENIRRPKQVLAKLNGVVEDKKIIIDTNYDYTEHQRDPSIYFNNDDKNYYIFLGAQTKNLKGCILLYKSSNLNDWDFLGEIKIEGYDDFGYMWECPSFTKIDGNDVLFFSPQGLETKNYTLENKDNNGYIVGEMDFEKLVFKPKSEFIQLDRGFEFYAAQTASDSNNTYLISWLGLPDIDTISDRIRSNSSLSLVRKLNIRENKVIQSPVSIDKYLSSKVNIEKECYIETKPMKLELKNSNKDFKIRIYSKKFQENSGLILSYKNDILELNRTNMDNLFNDKDRNIRNISLELKNLEIYIDSTSIEIFLNDGEYSLTSRILPSNDERYLYITSNDDIEISYSLINKIENNFII